MFEELFSAQAEISIFSKRRGGGGVGRAQHAQHPRTPTYGNYLFKVQ